MQMTSPIEPRKISPFEGFIPFFWLSIGCISGIIFSDFFHLSIWVWVSGSAISLSAWGLAYWLPERLNFTHRLRRWTHLDQRLPGVFLVVIFFLGGWRFTSLEAPTTIQRAAFFNNRESVQIIGLVIQPPDIRDSHTKLIVKIESLVPLGLQPENFEPGKVSGKVLLQVPSNRDWAYGDRLQVTGKLSEPYESGDFSYKDYLANKGIHSTMTYARVDWVEPGHGDPVRSFIFNLRKNGHDTLQKIFPSPEADLLSGILLGRDQGISRDLQNAFQLTGMTHIIAISGFNITILAGLFSSIFTRLLGHRSGAVAAVIGISAYTLMVGAEAAVVRAAIIGTLGVLGGVFGRRQNGLNSLGLAVLGMVVFDPLFLWDIGFQLSVAATLGLILYTQPLEAWFIKSASRWISEEQAKAWVGPISDIFLFTIAAQVMTLPIIAYHFGEVSWLALIANPLVLPPQSLVMILGGLALLAGMAIPGLGNLVAVLAMPFVRYTIRMVTIISQFPGADVKLPDFHVLWLVIFYAFLIFLTLTSLERRRKLVSKVISPGMALLCLTGGVVFVWNIVLSRPDGNLHLLLLDSEGTILIKAPDGKSLLIGGGPSPSDLNQALGELLPPGYKGLDALVIASTTKADVNALTGTLNVYTPGMVLSSVNPEANQTTRMVYSILTENDVPIMPVQTGQRLQLGSGIEIEFLLLEERGAVMLLKWDNFNALIPTGKVALSKINPSIHPSIILLPDDLDADELPMAAINQWSPSAILVPLAEADLPLTGEHALLTLFEGYPIVTTLDYRWIRVSTDGEQIWVSGE